MAEENQHPANQNVSEAPEFGHESFIIINMADGHESFIIISMADENQHPANRIVSQAPEFRHESFIITTMIDELANLNVSEALELRHESFHRFPDLPIRIQCMVWAYALPHRAVDVIIPTQMALVEGMCWQIQTAIANERAPVIAGVNRAARWYALSQCWWNIAGPDGSFPLPPLQPLNENSTLQEFLTRGPGFWFMPKHDIPVLYYAGEPIKDIQDLHRGCVEKYGRNAKQTAVYAPLAHPWPACYDNETQFERGLVAMPQYGWKDPLIVMETITIHATNEAACKSELFGLLGDAPVQLIDAYDTPLLAKYLTFMSMEELGGFKQDPMNRLLMKFVHPAWKAGLDECKQQYETIEVFRAWSHARNSNFNGVTDPENLWDGPREHQNVPLNMLDPKSLSLHQCTEGTYWLDVKKFRPNKSHPWVKMILAGLPPFRPYVMIRHCANMDCVESDEEIESGEEGDDEEEVMSSIWGSDSDSVDFSDEGTAE